MNEFETEKDKLSARSKVMANWTTSWETFSKEGPISPSIDVSINTKTDRFKNTKQKVNKSGKKLITKENSQQLLNNSISDKVIKTNDSDINNKLNQKDVKTKDKSIDEKLNNSNKHSNNEQKTNEIKTPNEKSLILSKLRKRKTPSVQVYDSVNNNTIDSNDNKTIEITVDEKNDFKQIDEKLETKKIDDKLETKQIESTVNNRVKESDIEVMEVDESSADNNMICTIKDCNNIVNKFALFENKFCSSDCAVKQWTNDFHQTWGQKSF